MSGPVLVADPECRHCGRLLDDGGQCWGCDTLTRTPWPCDRREALGPDVSLEFAAGTDTPVSLVVRGALAWVEDVEDLGDPDGVEAVIGLAMDRHDLRRLGQALLEQAGRMDLERKGGEL